MLHRGAPAFFVYRIRAALRAGGPVAALAVLSTVCIPARAQPATGPSSPQPAPETTPARPEAAPTVVPPRLVTSPTVKYPDGATGTSTVVLHVTVAPDGTVREVRVIERRDPFVTTATQAMRSARFDPATRRGDPVAATIRFEVRFVPPGPLEDDEVAVAEEPAATPDAPSAATEATYEVTVAGVRPAPGTQTLGKAEIRQLPGAFGDPFRAIEALPGVSPVVSGLPYAMLIGEALDAFTTLRVAAIPIAVGIRSATKFAVPVVATRSGSAAEWLVFAAMGARTEREQPWRPPPPSPAPPPPRSR